MTTEPGSVYHVYPQFDSREHIVDDWPVAVCWCNPRIEQVNAQDGYLLGYLITHTAADGRTNQAEQFLHGAN